MAKKNRSLNPLASALRAGENKHLKSLRKEAQRIIDLDKDFSQLSDEELRNKTSEFKNRLNEGATLDSLTVEAFATIREATWRTLKKKPYLVQIIGGLVLHQGDIAEMKTGEGKSITATLPSYLHALNGENVHVVTVNDYLATEQSAQMAQVFAMLDITVGCITDKMPEYERQQQYAADITYGTSNQFGFDYLRDNMALDPVKCVQRGQDFAIVDEIDSILIDEARTPLVISSAPGQISRLYYDANNVVTQELDEEDYEFNEKKKTASILESGIEKVEDYFGIENMYAPENSYMINFINNAIKAHTLFKRDKDYIVSESGKVEIVDEHTGRVLEGRSYNEGLHQALEAKEGVDINGVTTTMATTTLQNYFKLYNRLSGMSGTAQSCAPEFYSTYKMRVVQVPTNRPVQRVDHPDLVYSTLDAKLDAILVDIQNTHATGRPILIGTASVEDSAVVSQILTQAGLSHNTLNAENHHLEAQIIAQAGRKNAITVATNMAGRGTDILLGGNVEFETDAHMAMVAENPLIPESMHEQIRTEVIERLETETKAEKQEILDLGGLYVIGSERHESKRIDDQLRGRAGRQGDPGSSQFYVSLDDRLMRLFSGSVKALLSRYTSDAPISDKNVSRAIESAQKSVENMHAETRKETVKYDDVVSKQRNVIYSERQKILNSEVDTQIREFLNNIIQREINAIPDGLCDKENINDLLDHLSTAYPVGITASDLEKEYGSFQSIDLPNLYRELSVDAGYAVTRRSGIFIHVGYDPSDVERGTILLSLDQRWRDHLDELDTLREGVNLRSTAQKNPLTEFQTDAAEMYKHMIHDIEFACVQSFFGGPDELAIIRQQMLEENAIYSVPDASESGSHTSSKPFRTIKHEGKELRVELDENGEPIFTSRAVRKAWERQAARQAALT